MALHESVTLPDGRTLAYETYGDEDGAPLVFHHGTPGSHVLGAVLSEPARDRGVRVVAPSRPGYAGSDPNPDGETASWADDCEALADALDLRSFAVAGFSGGGPYALGVAAELPERVTGVGLVGSPVPENDAGPFGPLTRVPTLLGVAFRVGRWTARYRGDEFVVDQLTDEPIAEETANVVGRDFRIALKSGPSGAVRESRSLAEEWSLPTPDSSVTVWHGTADANVSISPVRTAYAEFSDASLVEVESDHLGTLLESREAVLALAE